MPRSTPTSDRYAVMKHKPSHHCGYIVQDGQSKTFALASCGKQSKRICFSVSNVLQFNAVHFHILHAIPLLAIWFFKFNFTS